MLAKILGTLVAAASLAMAQLAPAPDGWPTFTYKGIITDKEVLKYNPTDEFIFPAVFHAGYFLKDKALAQWYLYYAPHEDPGGISLVYSDSLDGPWTEYANNPVIENSWSPYYSAPHVSSPDAAWIHTAGKLFVYFHGSNSQTRWAETSDGVNFEYGGVAVNNAMGGSQVTETSYARVFRHPNAEATGYEFGMFYMGNERDDVRRIRLAESRDGRTWTVSPDYVVEPGPEEGKDVSGARLWPWKGRNYVIYHGSSGRAYARTIDKTLRQVGSTPILLYEASGEGDDVGRVAAPEIETHNGQTYLFYESGDRLGATIAWAKAS